MPNGFTLVNCSLRATTCQSLKSTGSGVLGLGVGECNGCGIGSSICWLTLSAGARDPLNQLRHVPNLLQRRQLARFQEFAPVLKFQGTGMEVDALVAERPDEFLEERLPVAERAPELEADGRVFAVDISIIGP